MSRAIGLRGIKGCKRERAIVHLANLVSELTAMTLHAVRNAGIEILKRRIARRHAELLEETREDVERAREETYGALAGPVTDSGDRATADLLSDLDHAEISRDVRELEKLEAALARIDQGTFGKCIECGAEIAFKRLAVYPVATRCAGCQGVYERTFGHPGEAKL
jgi:RNA polymerase-binding transcription factor